MAGRPHQARRGVRGRENKRDTTDRERWPGPKGEHRKKKKAELYRDQAWEREAEPQLLEGTGLG